MYYVGEVGVFGVDVVVDLVGFVLDECGVGDVVFYCVVDVEIG